MKNWILKIIFGTKPIKYFVWTGTKKNMLAFKKFAKQSCGWYIVSGDKRLDAATHKLELYTEEYLLYIGYYIKPNTTLFILDGQLYVKG